MTIVIGRLRIKFDFLFFAFMSYLLTVSTGKRVLLTILFSFFHECVHLIFICIYGKDDINIKIGFTGMKIDRNESMDFSLICESITALSAPVFNLLLSVVFYFFKYNDFVNECMYINLCLFIINILPVKTLDGGRFVYYFFSRFKNEAFAEKLLIFSGGTVCVVLIILSVINCKNVSLFFVAAVIVLFYIDSILY